MHSIYANNYLILPEFVTTDEAHSLYEYMKRQELEGACMIGDTQIANSPKFHNDLPLVRLLVREVVRVSKILNDPVLPTYAYGRIYKAGDVLERHRDRPSCEISITLNLYQEQEWPIWFQNTRGEEVSLLQKPGDAVLYLGCVSDHWRGPNPGNDYGQVFLHYVRALGPNAEHFFDLKSRMSNAR